MMHAFAMLIYLLFWMRYQPERAALWAALVLVTMLSGHVTTGGSTSSTVTVSVQLVGIYLVFASLILPALSALKGSGSLLFFTLDLDRLAAKLPHQHLQLQGLRLGLGGAADVERLL